MPTISVNISSALGRDLSRLNTTLRGAIKMGLRECGETVMTTSKSDYVPVDTGALRASGFVDEVEDNGATMSVSMGFGGAAKDYALIVHERMDTHHTVGQAKYLEEPANAFAPQVPDVMRKHVVRAVV